VIPIIFVVEFLGLFIKPAALAIRLFANMVGGHTLMATLLMFGLMAAKAGLGSLAIGGISLASGAFALIIFFLEIFVAFLQAFIFMFLTAVFISTMSHHDEEHAEEHAHAEAHH
jgi:F-type H+-transporting ATPase subunit a